jgi:hypothetical protein
LSTNHDHDTPEWLDALCEELVSCIESKGGMGGMSWWRLEPEDEDDFRLVLAPTPAGPESGVPDDGQIYYPIIHSFDLLAARDLFTNVTALAFGIENDGRPCITIEGQREGHEVFIQVFSEPLADAS